jgi:hypothetical protein
MVGAGSLVPGGVALATGVGEGGGWGDDKTTAVIVGNGTFCSGVGSIGSDAAGTGDVTVPPGPAPGPQANRANNHMKPTKKINNRLAIRITPSILYDLSIAVNHNPFLLP